MANFRVPHLAFGQADVHTTRAQFRSWIISVQRLVKRSRCEQRRVAIFLALLPPTRTDAPAGSSGQHHRTCHTPRSLPMNQKIDKRFFLIVAHASRSPLRSASHEAWATLICGGHRPPLQERKCSGAISYWRFSVSSSLPESVFF